MRKFCRYDVHVCFVPFLPVYFMVISYFQLLRKCFTRTNRFLIGFGGISQRCTIGHQRCQRQLRRRASSQTISRQYQFPNSPQ